MSDTQQHKVNDLQDLEIFQEAMEIGETVWALVEIFPKFAQNTVGYQFTRSADSISANIAEGYGRYHYKDNRQFCYYARGSLRETEVWLTKAVKRDLVSRDEGKLLYEKLLTLRKRLQAYIHSIERHLQ